jgi:DNA-binding NarL/FixJ family response regulator
MEKTENAIVGAKMLKKQDKEKLTLIEEAILRMLVGNMTNKEIAFALELKESLLEESLQNIYRKLRVKDSFSAIKTALEKKFFSVAE